MPIIKATEPVTKAPIDVIVGTPEELVRWYHKHGRKDFEQKDKVAGHANRLHKDGAVYFLAWFLCEDLKKGVALRTIVHECFHLYAYVCGTMQGSEYFSIDSSDNEDDAYHFANLFEEIEHAVQKGLNRIAKSEVVNDIQSDADSKE